MNFPRFSYISLVMQVVALLATSFVSAATITVTNVNDSGPGSLRQAILDANASSGLDTIAFNIPGTGPHTIQPLSALPSITDPVVVDGYTQPGTSANTNPPELGSNAVLKIELDGSMATTGPPPPSVHGLVIAAGGSTVRGLVINRFVTGDGIRFSTEFGGIGGEGNNLVEGNFIGTDLTGTAALGNNRAVTIVNPNNRIGGRVPEARNVLSGNDFGVWLQDDLATGNLVEGNYIGTAADGVSPLGNTFDGVIITRGSSVIGANGNVVGGSASSAGNTIAFNGRVGVFIQVGSVRNAILSNSIFSNGVSQPAGSGLGIDLLDPFGITANDVGDGDTGANNLQNYPVLTSATSGSAIIEGNLNSTANNTFRLEFFSNTACDSSGNGEGERFLGSTNVTTDGSGNASFVVSLPVSVPVGQFATATATDPNGNTSEFSQCVETTAGPGVTVVDIDIKPGNKRNLINPSSKGGIWVAILSDTNPDSPFDPSSQVVIPTVEFGRDGAKSVGEKVDDINNDGLGDLLLRFKIPETGMACGDTEATLIGETMEGQTFTGTDSVQTVGCK